MLTSAFRLKLFWQPPSRSLSLTHPPCAQRFFNIPNSSTHNIFTTLFNDLQLDISITPFTLAFYTFPSAGLRLNFLWAKILIIIIGFMTMMEKLHSKEFIPCGHLLIYFISYLSLLALGGICRQVNRQAGGHVGKENGLFNFQLFCLFGNQYVRLKGAFIQVKSRQYYLQAKKKWE